LTNSNPIIFIPCPSGNPANKFVGFTPGLPRIIQSPPTYVSYGGAVRYDVDAEFDPQELAQFQRDVASGSYKAAPNFLGMSVPPQNGPPLMMHVLPGTSATNYDDIGAGAFGDAGGAFGNIAGGTHKGYDFSDTAGATGQTPGFRDFFGGGGVGATLDARKWFGLGGNQSLLFGASVDGQSFSRTFDADAGKISGASMGGSLSALYASRAFYATGNVVFDWGRNDITDNTTTGQGAYNSNDVSTDVRVGKLFPLWGGGSGYRGTPSHTPLFLDVSGHIGYSRGVAGGYTDSTGAVFGDETEQYWTGGGRVRLMSLMLSNGILWTPFVGATVDQQFDYNHTFDISAQGGAPADQLLLTQAGTFVGAEAGLYALTRSGVSVGGTGFYSHSADQNGGGGNLTLLVPF
jgi:hypothetical protein